MKTRKILLGKKSHRTSFGLIGCSHGASYGGYNNYYYGIKGVFAFCIYEGWRQFSQPHKYWPNLYK
jgi:hypothetical protein